MYCRCMYRGITKTDTHTEISRTKETDNDIERYEIRKIING